MTLDSADLGVRRIRSAGRSSGSVVITLPPELAGLSGLDCSLSLTIGAEPVIEMRPDWKAVHAALDRAWCAMQLGLYGNNSDFDAIPWGLARFVARLGKPAVSDRRADLALENIGALWQRDADLRIEDRIRLIRWLGSVDALLRGQPDTRADDYGRALSYLITSVEADLDLFIVDLVASAPATLVLPKDRRGMSIGDPEPWSRYAAGARHLRQQLFEEMADGRDRRSDWATAVRFERLSA